MGPILEKIDENYAVLKEHAEMQWLISDFEQHLQSQSELSTFGKSMGRVLEILEGKSSKHERMRLSLLTKAKISSSKINFEESVNRKLFKVNSSLAKDFDMSLI